MSQLILSLLLVLAHDLLPLTAAAPAPAPHAAAATSPAVGARGPGPALPTASRVERGSGAALTAARRTLGPAQLPGAGPARRPASAGVPQAWGPQDPPPPIQAVLRQIRGVDVGQLAVSEEDGRLLRVLVAASGAKRALEIGGASGYSGIWIGLGLRETGGHLTTIEYDAGRAREAVANIGRAGLAGTVRVVQGDAFKEIPKLPGTFDFVFLDAWKKDYKRFLDLVLPRLEPGALFLAHNVVNKRDEMPDFLAAIQQSPALLTAIVTPSGEGVSISWKKR